MGCKSWKSTFGVFKRNIFPAKREIISLLDQVWSVTSHPVWGRKAQDDK